MTPRAQTPIARDACAICGDIDQPEYQHQTADHGISAGTPMTIRRTKWSYSLYSTTEPADSALVASADDPADLGQLARNLGGHLDTAGELTVTAYREGYRAALSELRGLLAGERTEVTDAIVYGLLTREQMPLSIENERWDGQ